MILVRLHHVVGRKRAALVGALVAGLLALVVTAGVSADGAARAEFEGRISGYSPCDGEWLTLVGQVHVVYQEAGQHIVHLTFKPVGTGSRGTAVSASIVANGRFAAPSAAFGDIVAFDVPFRAQVIGAGSAPDFSVEGTFRVFVENGRPVGAWIISAPSRTCHG